MIEELDIYAGPGTRVGTGHTKGPAIESEAGVELIALKLNELIDKVNRLEEVIRILAVKNAKNPADLDFINNLLK